MANLHKFFQLAKNGCITKVDIDAAEEELARMTMDHYQTMSEAAALYAENLKLATQLNEIQNRMLVSLISSHSQPK